MEYIFENVYVDSEQLLQQTYAKMLNKRRIFLTVLSFVLALLFGLVWLALDRSVYFWGAVIYVGFAVWYWLLPYRVAKKAYKNMLKLYDGTIPPTVVRFDEKITLSQGDTFHSMPYQKLKSVSFLKDCILLHNEVGGCYIVANDGFTKGSKQELAAFLKEKCPQLKLPDWQW